MKNKQTSPKKKDAFKRSKEIDYAIELERRNYDEIPILIVGGENSGKSTILKQILLKYSGQMEEDLFSYKPLIYENIFYNIKSIINIATNMNIDIEDIPNKVILAYKLIMSNETGQFMEMLSDVAMLWKDPGIQKAYSLKDRLIQLNDNANYFFENMERLLDPSFIPTFEDVLTAKLRSKNSIESHNFKLNRALFKITDMCGQRGTDRRKWIHHFEYTSMLIFVVDVSDYSQPLFEDNSLNRLLSSLKHLDEISSCDWFRTSTMVILLNKTDLLREKLKTIDLSVCFHDYTGGNDYSRAIEFIKNKFQEVFYDRSSGFRSHPYIFNSCAINVEEIRNIIENVFYLTRSCVFDSNTLL